MSVNQNASKKRKLDALRKEILSAMPEAWLFPTVGKVQGFLGASPVMFVAERPSTGEFANRSFLEQFGALSGEVRRARPAGSAVPGAGYTTTFWGPPSRKVITLSTTPALRRSIPSGV